MNGFPDLNGHVRRYLELMEQLHALRARAGGSDCPEEDALLDEMGVTWVERVLSVAWSK